MKKKKNNPVYLPEGSNIIEMLIREKIPFEIIFTNRTSTIKLKEGNKKYIISEKKLKFKELGFIRQVKSYAEKRNIKSFSIKPKDIKYLDIGKVLG